MKFLGPSDDLHEWIIYDVGEDVVEVKYKTRHKVNGVDMSVWNGKYSGLPTFHVRRRLTDKDRNEIIDFIITLPVPEREGIIYQRSRGWDSWMILYHLNHFVVISSGTGICYSRFDPIFSGGSMWNRESEEKLKDFLMNKVIHLTSIK